MKSEMEEALEEMMEKVKASNPKKINSVGETGLICPLCGGEVRENKAAYGCSNYKEGCKFTIWKKFMNNTFSEKEVAKLIQGESILKTVTSKAGKKWKQSVKYDKAENKIIFD